MGGCGVRALATSEKICISRVRICAFNILGILYDKDMKGLTFFRGFTIFESRLGGQWFNSCYCNGLAVPYEDGGNCMQYNIEGGLPSGFQRPMVLLLGFLY